MLPSSTGQEAEDFNLRTQIKKGGRSFSLLVTILFVNLQNHKFANLQPY